MTMLDTLRICVCLAAMAAAPAVAFDAAPKGEPAPKAEPAPKGEPAPKAEPKTETPPAADGIDDLIKTFEAAAKAGDLDKVAGLFADPLGPATKELVDAADQVSAAAKAFSAALDERFGKPITRDVLSMTDLSDRIRDAYRRVDAVTIKERKSENAERVALTLSIVEKDDKGALRTRVETYAAIRQGAGFRLLPKEAEKELKAMRDRAAGLKKLPESIGELRKALAAGKYKERDDAVVALNRALLAVVGD